MQRLRAFLGLIAAIILMIGGAPTSASANPCNPCPPDCAMMAQMAKAVDHHGQLPGKSGKAETPCKSAVVCQSAFAVPLLPQTVVAAVMLAEITDHDLVGSLAAPSRPPDPTLRPPIQL